MVVHADLTAIQEAVIGGGVENRLETLIERCAGRLVGEIVDQGLAQRAGNFLYDYGVQVGRGIEDYGEWT